MSEQDADDICGVCLGKGTYDIWSQSSNQGWIVSTELCSCAAAVELLKQQNDEQADYIAKLESESEAMKAWEKVAELEAQLAQARSGRWVPVKGSIIIELGPGTIVQFREDGYGPIGEIQNYPDKHRLCEWVEGEDMPADVRQNILDMCDDWKQSGYEDDELGFDYERAHVVMDWLQRQGGAA